MVRIYIIVMGAMMLIGTYFVGTRVGVARCRANVAAQSMQAYVQIIKNKENINAETNHTAVRDIRRILRERYTISQ